MSDSFISSQSKLEVHIVSMELHLPSSMGMKHSDLRQRILMLFSAP